MAERVLTEPKIVDCTLCETRQEVKPIQGMTPDMPRGWSIVTIAEQGWQVQNFRICRRCTQAVRSTVGQLIKGARNG